MLVDSHCHLDFEIRAGTRRGRGTRARRPVCCTCVSIGTSSTSSKACARSRSGSADVWCSVGVHPHEAEDELLDGPQILIELRETSQGRRHRRDRARLLLRAQPARTADRRISAPISLRRARPDLPLIVHTRDADDDTIRVLREEMAQGAVHRPSPLFHGHADAWPMRRSNLACTSRSPGIATFKKSDALRDVLKDVPLDRLLVETDAPYLAPVPHRGKRNEPAFVVHTAAMLAELKGLAPDELARATTENFFRLFTKVARPAVSTVLEAHDPGLRFVGRRAASRRTGQCRTIGAPAIPTNPKNRRTRCSLLVRQKIARPARPRYSSTPRRTCASNCSTRAPRRSMPC